MPTLPGVFAGEAGCSAFAEPVGRENDRPAEKRKVNSSILSLTTTWEASRQPSRLRKRAKEREIYDD